MAASTTSTIRSALFSIAIVLLGGICGFFFFRNKGVDDTSTSDESQNLKGITSIALGPDEHLYLGGRFGVRILNKKLETLGGWSTPDKVSALEVDESGNIYAAHSRRVVKYTADGKQILQWGKPGDDDDAFGYVTGIASASGNIFVADAGARAIYRFNSEGEFLNLIESVSSKSETTKFSVPSPYFDCAVRGEALYVGHPGVWQVEKYDFDGNLLSFWGGGGNQDEQFPGCCNPTNIEIFTDGRVAVSQKGEPCVKVYDNKGNLLRLFGKSDFHRAAKGIDLAIDKNGTIYATDPHAGEVRIYRIESSARKKGSDDG
jgi:hypothetical protein